MKNSLVLLSSLLTRKEIEKKVKTLFSFFINSENEDNYNDIKKENIKYNIYKDFESVFNFKYSLISKDCSEDSTKFMFELLKNYFQNEFYIKRKFVLSKFINEEKDIIKFEFKLKNSRLDLLKIDTKKHLSFAYEVKTAFDNFSRLKKQLEDYSKVFDFVYIITSLSHKKELDVFLKNNIILNHVGVFLYDEKRKYTTFKKYKNACKSPLLNKEELISFIDNNELKFYFNSLDKNKIINSYKIEYINYLFKTYLINKYSLRSNEIFLECKKLK